jgi:hypothetical protein
MSSGSSSLGMNKEARFNQLNEARKLKREDLIMKRRGLNFINDNNKREEFEEVKDNKPTVSKTNLGQKRDIKKNYSFF